MDYYMNRKVTYLGQYPAVYFPEHYRATNTGLVYVHVLVAETILSRRLESDECVHHIDGNRKNYDVRNLMVFQTQSDHARYHAVLANHIQDYSLICERGAFRCIIKNYRRCSICGNPISQKARICLSCYKLEQASHIPSREELVDLLNITNSNYSEIGRKYGVTGNAVKKWLKKYDLYVCRYDLPT